MWFLPGTLWQGTPSYSTPNIAPTMSGVAFMAYGYPANASSSTGYESCGSMVTFMVQDESCMSYVLVLIDKAGCGKGGYIKMDMYATGVTTDPVAFQNDPHHQPGVPPGYPT